MKKFLNERNGKLFAKLFENQGVKVNEGDYDMERAPDKFSPPLQKIAAKADTTPEIVAMFKWVKDQVKELTKGTATDLEIKKAFELVLKDMKNTIGKVVQDTTSEVHAAVNPDNPDVDQTDDKEKDLDTDSDQ
tara:strand:- start:72 stop:470 length:399 start_codon:yes stop_codon:yes gene_type:complete